MERFRGHLRRPISTPDDITAGMSERSLENVSLGLSPSIAVGVETRAFDALVGTEGDSLLQASAAVGKAYFVQIGLDFRFLRTKTFTSVPVGAMEYLSGRPRGEETWLSLLRKAVVKDLEQIPSDIDAPRIRPLEGSNRLNGERLSVGSIEEIVEVILATNGGNFLSADLQLAGIANDVYKVYPGRYMGLREKFSLPENLPGNGSPRRKASEGIQVYPFRRPSGTTRKSETGEDLQTREISLISHPSEAERRRARQIATLRTRLAEVPQDVLAGGFFGFHDAGLGGLAGDILKLGGPTFEANLAKLMQDDKDNGNSNS